MATFDMRDERAEAGTVTSVSTQAFDVVVIGGGPAGMAAAMAAHKAGARVTIVEREPPPVHPPRLWPVAL